MYLLKNLYVLLESELEEIIEAQSQANKAVMVGFNRRFSPLTDKLKKAIGNNPMTMFIGLMQVLFLEIIGYRI